MEKSNENQENVKTEEKELKKKKNSKIRMLLVILFLIIFAIISYVQLRGSYLEYLELGESYTNIFKTNITYRYTIMGINFVALYVVVYLTNRGIKKGLKPFFEKEEIQIPKLPNKSLALVISAIASFIVSAVFMQKIMLATSNASFGIQDPIFGLDISYYMFLKPLIETAVFYFVVIFICLSLYMALYYVIVFNRYFDGIDGKMLKESLFMKKLLRNIMVIVIGIAILTILGTQNVMFGKILTVGDDIEINGAGMTEATVQVVGYFIFAFIIVIFAYRALKAFKAGKTNKVLKNLAIIPGYLVILFVAMIGFDLIYVNSNELDKERNYISENIKNTKSAYNIEIEETNIESSGTITQAEVDNNSNVINNIPIISKTAVEETLENNQSSAGYYVYPNTTLAKYNINGEEKLVYLSPREITNSGRTYSNRTYEYTHGMGEIITLATESTESGNIKYVQSDVSGSDQVINVTEPRIYFGLETDETIATNAKNKQEYDYTDKNGNDIVSTYEGKAGLNLNFLDRLVLGISKGDLNLAFSSEMTNDSKILINRDIVTRAKKAMPYLIYDEEPYTVITEDGKIVWVLDAYTVSSSYPFSQYTTIVHDGISEDINYIRNSVKVIIDSYDGTMDFYITDRTDPIAMAYRNIYKDLFKVVGLDAEIPEDISSHFVYPKFLYNVQADILKVYHNTRPDVIYRGDDLWDIAKYSSTSNTTNTTGTYIEPYYTMVKTRNGENLGLVQVYTPNERQNVISYLVGSNENGDNVLRLYKFSADSNIVGPMQLDKQIEEDLNISQELETLNVTGTKLTKQMIIVPINNTLLYVEPVYQTMLNESDVPILKKVIVASGNKVAIGDTLTEALQNLLSRYATNIEVEDTEDIEGLINAIIRANQNLTESNENNDWEMMGSDLARLQELINRLEQAKEEEERNNTDKEDLTTNTESGNEINSTNTSSDGENIMVMDRNTLD